MLVSSAYLIPLYICVLIPLYVQADEKGADGLGFVQFGAVTGIPEAPWTGTSDTYQQKNIMLYYDTYFRTAS